MKCTKHLLLQTPSLSLVVLSLLASARLEPDGLAAPEPAGWYVGDPHAHRSCGSSPVSVSSIYTTMVNQNLNVISLLADMGNGEVQNPKTDLPLVNGQDASVSTAGRIVHWDAEWHWDATYTQYAHQALGGHLVALGLTNAYQLWSEYTFPVLDWAHQQGGIAGFAHFQYLGNGFPQSLTCCTPIEYPVEVALGACDFISEDVAGSDVFLDAYYRLLNCGFRPGLAAGSDYPCGAAIGSCVTFAQVAGGELSYRGWLQGITDGRTVVSRNGRNEFLALTVNGAATPGDEIQLSGPGSVQVSVTWAVNQNLSGTMELVKNGQVVASKPASATASAPATMTTTVTFTQSGWLCARRMGSGGHASHTAAVFVTVDHAPVRASVADAQFYVDWMDQLLQKTSPGGEWSSYFVSSRLQAQARYSAARAVFAQIASEAAGPQPLTIVTTSLPDAVRDQAYSATLSASGGSSPYRWSLVSGTLPTGLNLSSGGSLSGTPTAVGSSGFTVRVQDASSPVQSATQALVLTIQSNSGVGGTIGNTNDGTATDNLWDTGAWINAGRFLANSNLTVTAMRAKVGAVPGKYQCAIYTDSSSRPSRLLRSSAEVSNPASGWQTFPLSGSVTLTNGQYYWLAIWSDNSGAKVYYSGTGTLRWGQYNYGAWPDPLSTSGGGSLNYCIYASGTTLIPTLVSMAVTPAMPSLLTGATLQFKATGTYSDGGTKDLSSQVTWASSAPGVATITSAGLATGIGAGTTTISATSGTVAGSTTLTVQVAPLAVTTASLANGTLNVPYSATLTASGGTLPYTWSIASGTLPAGLTLNSTSGAITGTPTAVGSSSFTVRVQDASSPAQSATKGLGMSVSAAVATIWPNSTVPGLVDGGPDGAVELGVKFRSDVAGTITGLRFYKASANTGTHVGNLWTTNGTRLASVTFSGETASGWQQASLTNPVTITPNTVYVASYHANNGHYSADVNYFSGKGMDSPPLHALATGVSGANGVYAYGASSAFPNQSWSAANYWVDVLFQAGPAPTLNSIAVTPAAPSIVSGATQQFTATGTYSDGSTKDLSSQVTWASSAAGVATITSAGLATGIKAGTTTISATSGTVAGSTTLTVQTTPLAVTTTSLANGTLNVAYSATLTASGGTLPYTWSIASGSLPAGLALNSASGAITGTPTAVGSSSFTVGVSDAGSPVQSATQALVLTIQSSSGVGGIIGNTNDGTATDNLWDTRAWINAGRFLASSNLTVTAMRAKVGAVTGKYQCALYTDSSSQPSRLLRSSSEVSNPASGWQTFPLSASVTLTNGQYYWLAIWSDNPGAKVYYSGTGTLRWGQYNYGAWPDPVSTSGGGNLNYCIYASGTTQIPTLVSIAVTPANSALTTGETRQFTATGTYSDGSTKDLSSQVTWASSAAGVATITSVGLATGTKAGTTTISATSGTVAGSTTLTVQTAPLAVTTASLANGTLNVPYSATLSASGGTLPYTWSMASGTLPAGLALNSTNGAITGTPTAVGSSSFTVRVQDASSQAQSATRSLALNVTASAANPILVVTNAANPFNSYYGEILLTEGLNEFEFKDLSSISSASLAPYDVVILGTMALSTAQVTSLTDWVNAGGKLIAMRPDKQLAGLLGLSDTGATLSESYLLVDPASGPGGGIVSQTLQFHGTADRYTLNGASSIANLCSDARTPTANPAVTWRSIGANGGAAAAFTYELARSIVLTRQGNPAWAGQERDGIAPIRSDDLFYGPASFDPQPDWVDFNKIAIPQADEQQRLLANLIIFAEASSKLLPRFWYFPHGYSAVVVMTGDDHAGGGTAGRFDDYRALSPASGSVDDWTAIRSTSYIFPNSHLTDAQAAAYNAAGFEIGFHLDTGCANWTRSTLDQFFTTQRNAFLKAYPSLPSPTTHRIHCIAWCDYTSAAELSLTHGIRLDTSYYYWPPGWVDDQPGLFTGSGMPMRFATSQGDIIDVYQAPSQMTDESGQTYPKHIDALLDKALGPEGYYGAFVANMHTDSADSPGSDAILSSALSRGVPIIASRQLLKWLDARNGSSFKSVLWTGSSQTFTVVADPNARGIQALVPIPTNTRVSSVKQNGTSIPFAATVIKGITYAIFPATSATYELSYVAVP